MSSAFRPYDTPRGLSSLKDRSPPVPQLPPPPDELRAALRACRGSFLFAALFSLFINLILLVPAMYMLQIYDRVLASRSGTTLLMLTLIALGLYAVMGILDLLRARILVRVGTRLDLALDGRLFMAMFDGSLRGLKGSAQPIADLTALRQFLTGNGLFAFFDVPWMPVYIAVLFLLHPVLGWMSVGGALVLSALAAINEHATRRPLRQANALAAAGGQLVTGNLRNAEALESMGMLPAVHRRWLARHLEVLRLQSIASDRAGLLGSLSKSLRIALQSAILGVGAWLAVQQAISAGAMIAGSILMGRALAPLDQLIGAWKGFLAARGAYGRLNALLAAVPARAVSMSLPPPKGELELEDLVVVPPGAKVPALRRVSFAVAAGESIGVIGPSAAGKSTLARAVLGVWSASAGSVRLDGADIRHWNRHELGPYLGYLPQDIELLDGTVGQNIARFGEVDAAQVVAAAQRAGVHEMVLRLPQGYDTPIGEGGAVLSGGQRQRIGLARAMYGNPRLVVLDEPNSNLDEQGESALIRAIAQLKTERATVLIVTHRPSILNGVDRILVLREGAVDAYGPREQILSRFTRPAAIARPETQANAAG
jgi:ATP-binding cassette, subfamily C, bacterial EexD